MAGIKSRKLRTTCLQFQDFKRRQNSHSCNRIFHLRVYRNEPGSSVKAYNLRSSGAVLLDAHSLRTKVTLGDRAFQVAAPKLWNSLLSELRLIDNIDIFKRHLKMYLCISKEKQG